MDSSFEFVCDYHHVIIILGTVALTTHHPFYAFDITLMTSVKYRIVLLFLLLQLTHL